jgi:hypothetical protein
VRQDEVTSFPRFFLGTLNKVILEASFQIPISTKSLLEKLLKAANVNNERFHRLPPYYGAIIEHLITWEKYILAAT